MSAGARYIVGIGTGTNDPAVIVTLGQLLWIVLADVVGGMPSCYG